jgi:hypothetical protein
MTTDDIPPADRAWINARYLVADMLDGGLAGKDRESQAAAAEDSIEDMSTAALRALCVQLAGWVAGNLKGAARAKLYGMPADIFPPGALPCMEAAVRQEIETTSAELREWAFLDESKPWRGRRAEPKDD